MNPLAGKVLLVSVPTAGIAGTGVYFGFIRPSQTKETIKSKLEKANSKLRSRAILSSSKDAIGSKFKVLYKNEKDASKKIRGVDENDLPDWCETTLVKDYSENEKSKYEEASRGCVANINTLKEELESEKKLSFITFGSSDATKGQNAWTKYERDKGTLIIEDDLLKNVQPNNAETGGPKLQAGCKAKLGKHMYEDLGEDKTIEKVTKYCVSSRGV